GGGGGGGEGRGPGQAPGPREVGRGPRGRGGGGPPALPAPPAPAVTAEVRVFPPVPLDGWPRELAKLQVSGTELAEQGVLPPAGPGQAVLWLSPDLEMSTGKEMAQVGHGAQLLWYALPEAARKAWREAGFPLAVRTAPPARWSTLTASGLPLVRDAGFTEIAPGSCTVVAEPPAGLGG
uniref:peptidyl-tRNA hydrolase n=1 Tax=Streptomyces sp. ODS05-4 TaxID=2944939 RepID=UPI0035B3C0C4